ncbi:hypothetical protein [Vibrio mediterranei]|uniref:hypothetical protein n=1 Tax=Vibrio mediterranei TaxID=689 RepID=UPI0040688FCB
MNNKLGCAAYALFFIGCALPLYSITMWGVSASMKGYEVMPIGLILGMGVGLFLTITGAPKLLAKGFVAILLTWLLFDLYGLYQDAAQMYAEANQLRSQFGGRSNDRVFEAVINQLVEGLQIGVWAFVAWPVASIAFLIAPYTENDAIWGKLKKAATKPESAQ